MAGSAGLGFLSMCSIFAIRYSASSALWWRSDESEGYSIALGDRRTSCSSRILSPPCQSSSSCTWKSAFFVMVSPREELHWHTLWCRTLVCWLRLYWCLPLARWWWCFFDGGFDTVTYGFWWGFLTGSFNRECTSGSWSSSIAFMASFLDKAYLWACLTLAILSPNSCLMASLLALMASCLSKPLIGFLGRHQLLDLHNLLGLWRC